jgi:hypothetical protein
MLANVKQSIGGILTRFRKAINPIRWLGYVRPDEVIQPSVLATQGDKDMEFLLQTAIEQRDELQDRVDRLEQRLEDCDCDEIED